MKTMAAVLVTAMIAAPLQGQGVGLRGGLGVFGEGPLDFEAATWAVGVLRDIPKHTELGAEAVRIGALWIDHGVSFVEFPALLLYGSDGQPDRAQAFLAVGASLGVRVDEPGFPPCVMDCYSGYHRFNLSGVAGAGFTVPMGHLSWGGELLYMHGLPKFDHEAIRPLVFMFGVGMSR